MNPSLLALRKVKYRPLPQLLNRQIRISSIGQIEKEVLAEVSRNVPGDFRLTSSSSNIELILAKYGFLDLDFVTSQNLLNLQDRINRSAIRELGYTPRPRDPAPDMEPELKKQLGSDRSCLEVLLESVKEDTSHLRIFLNSEWSRDSMARIFDEVRQEQLNGKSANDIEAVTSAIFAIAERIKDSFPITFTIEDACLTNSDAIWLAKHGYL